MRRKSKVIKVGLGRIERFVVAKSTENFGESRRWGAERLPAVKYHVDLGKALR